MSAAFTDHLADYLAAAGLGTVASSIWLGEMPPEAEGLLLVDTGGGPGDRLAPYLRLTVQVTARYAVATTAKARAWAVHDLVGLVDHPARIGNGPVWGLDQWQNGNWVQGPRTTILQGRALQPPFSLGRDERQKWRWVVNLQFLVPNG